MLTMLTLTALLVGQVSDAPRSARLTDVKAAPEWIGPSLTVMGLVGGGPLLATAGYAMHAAFTGITATVASLAIPALIALAGATIVGAIMLGLALEELALKTDRLLPRRLAVWPWFTSAIAVVAVGGVGLVLATLGGGGFAFMSAAFMTALIGGPILLGLCLGGMAMAVANGARRTAPTAPCSADSQAECRGAALFTF